VQSFGTEVATGAKVALLWGNLKPGTYLIESGTHPSIQGPMGLYGVLVVTTAPGAVAGVAYPATATTAGVNYNADVPLLFSEIDGVQNGAVDSAVHTAGFSETATRTLRDILSTIIIISPGSNYTAATVAITAGGGRGATATATVDTTPGSPTLGQVTAITITNPGNGYSSTPTVTITGNGSGATAVAGLSLAPSLACGGAGACYPPVVNYDPRYYLINGVSFDRTHAGNSLFATNPASASGGTVLMRFVNAGLRMHVPSVVGAQTTQTVGMITSVVSGFSLIAEDGNVLPGNPRVQTEVFLAAGKTYDVMINAPAAGAPALPVFDRQLSLSTNNQRDGGMQAYVSANGVTTPPASVGQTAAANPDKYFLVAGKSLTVSDPAKGVMANDIGIYGVQVSGAAPAGLTLIADGTFTYTGGPTMFNYCGNGAASGSACTTVTIAACTGACMGGAPTAGNPTYTSNVSSLIKINAPGVLAFASDPSNLPLMAELVGTPTGVTMNSDGSFTVARPNMTKDVTTGATITFQYQAVNSQGSKSNPTTGDGTVTITFKDGSGLNVTLRDAVNQNQIIQDYSWVIEEDSTIRTPAGVTTGTTTPTLSTSFHKSAMTLVASGCTGDFSCRSGQSVLGVPVATQPAAYPSQVALDTSKYYYISVLPGDSANPFVNGGGAPVPVNPQDPNSPLRQFDLAKDCDFTIGTGNCGHTMGGVPVPPPVPPSTAFAAVTVLAQQSPLPTAQLSVFVFEDDNPTNGSIDGVEEQQGLGGFQIILVDVAGATGDATGQMTYDMFNMPLTNALVGTIDTATHADMCPISASHIVGMIITCPELESDGVTRSPLAGQALIKNLFPNRFDVFAYAAADREAKGEHWLQTSTLEGTPANDAFAKAGEPAYFQEFGAPGFHSFIGFVNPDHIKARNAALGGKNTVKGTVTNLHMSRPWSEALSDSQSHEPIAQSTCYVGANSQNGIGANLAFAACDADGNFTLTGLPNGQYQIVVWDQWLDQIIEFQSYTIPLPGATTQAGVTTSSIGDIPVFSWFNSVYTSTYFDLNHNGVLDNNEPGLNQVPIRMRFRNGQISNTNTTDNQGNAAWAEIFPLFSWYVMESDTTRYKGTGVHTINDAGGPVDTTGAYAGFLNSTESFSVPAARRVPGAIYSSGKTERIDPGTTTSEGIQSFISQPQFIEWGKIPYAEHENGGIVGHVAYGSTRPFDDPALLFQNLWEPLVPQVTVNLYQEGTAADGTQSLTLVDTTTTSSWDDWANGYRMGANGQPFTDANGPIGNMNCPGQDPADPYYTYTLGTANRYKCYDGMHNWNQMQPAPYDGRYQFPSSAYIAAHPLTTAQTNAAQTLVSLPPGKYVAAVVVPPGYELVKEEDKNILIGDTYIAPVAQQFAGLGSIFILPDQASVNAYYNSNNANNPTTNMGRTNLGDFGPGGLSVMPAPCVGQVRIVPDYMSLFPQAHEVAPFAGASRPLCDRREITLEDQMQAQTDFFIFTQTPVSAHYTGMILDDMSSEFNTYAPDFGEKFAVPFVPVSFRDFNGIEISRVYADQFGMYDGLVYSTWQVNPPNPTGYAPNMMITCMNDPGPIPDPKNPGQLITDPMYNPMYSNFCYTWPFMPGNTAYMDTPVLPTAAFASGYNPVDCAYPDATPAIKSVNGDGQFGPWVSGPGATLTINALGDVMVPNNAYVGPGTVTANGTPIIPTGLAAQKTILRHYGFGNTRGTVTINGVALAGVIWSDLTISGTIPAGTTTGELIITAADGKRSVDTVTVTVGGTVSNYVTAPPLNVATGSGFPHPIQDAIDAALPGDLIMLGPGSYPELVIMWKPVRLQGVGAASVIINAAKYPTQKLEQWRTRINALFGLDLQGNAIPGVPQADPLPGQQITGGVVLLEPSVLTTEEGAGITVLAKNAGTLQQPNCGSSANLSNFLCAPSRIDGVSITGGDAGGGIYVNGWAHNLEVSNNRVYGNAGVFTGGVRIGQPYLIGTDGAGPFGYNTNVKIHHNSITHNGSLESNQGQGGAGAAISMCTGTDNYLVNFNFVCGNFGMGDGGGIGHIGVSWKGEISNNWILFNQTSNQSATTSGGGLVIEGETGTGTTLSLGTGDVTVDSNLIQGNHAKDGHGGGVRLQDVNGADVARNPNLTGYWWQVNLTNNIIVDNVAGWAGGGISLVNTVFSSIINNTVAANDSTATAGPIVHTTPAGTSSVAQPAGISAEPHSPALAVAFGPTVSSTLTSFSNPFLENNILWRNRWFYFTVTSAPGTGANPGSPATTTLVPNLTVGAGYACPTSTNYWDLGVLGQPNASNAALKLNPTYSILTSTSGYNSTSAHNSSSNPRLMRQYCNGSRSNPGIPDTTPPNPAFTFPSAIAVAGTEDEGGNWVDVRYGPLSLTDSSIGLGSAGYGNPVGDYRICASNGNPTGCTAASPAIDTGNSQLAPNHDYFGTRRPQGADFDMGAHEVVNTSTAGEGEISVTPAFVDFGAQQIGTVISQTIRVTNNGNVTLTGLVVGPLAGANPGQFTRTTNCGGTLNAGASCTITAYFRPSPTAAGVGPKVATLNVSDGDPGSTPVQIRLSGLGQRPSGTVLPTALAFGSQLVNTITVAVAQPVTVTNTGVGPLVISSIVINGANPNQFHQTNVNCPIGGLGLPVGGTCTVNVTFTPTSLTPANKNATLTVRFASAQTQPSQVQTVSLTGTATAVAVTQAPLAFGTAPPADTTLTVQVNNNAANGTLTITSRTITAGGAYFTIAPTTTCNAGSAVAPGNSCDINVTFTRTPPNSTANRTGNLRIVTPSGTFSVPLSGN